MTPDLSKLLVRPALLRWLTEHGYAPIEDYPLRDGVTADVYASSAIHQHAMVIKAARAVTPPDLRPLVTALKTMRGAARPDVVIAVAVPLDGITETMRLKLVEEKVQVIVLPATMTNRQYLEWMADSLSSALL
jgi:hypothetical protein